MGTFNFLSFSMLHYLSKAWRYIKYTNPSIEPTFNIKTRDCINTKLHKTDEKRLVTTEKSVVQPSAAQLIWSEDGKQRNSRMGLVKFEQFCSFNNMIPALSLGKDTGQNQSDSRELAWKRRYDGNAHWRCTRTNCYRQQWRHSPPLR